ncbi:ROK family protein [Microbacterium aquilitoris]|uniref:ROK family protein n=1 Tax=Microbacterium aquilitoris TaxID=3067307 RepID=UPI00288C8AB1|nr:ROK family protein [Microbacterium sp. KSW2-22]MDT3344793.1 ROK family protein [Microbacterium sp. KSW2-22]
MRVGIDVGGTKTLAVAVDDGGRVVATDRRATGRGAEAVVDGICAAVHAVLGDAPPGPVGVGMPGQVSPGGVVRHALNLGIGSVDLAEAVAARIGVRPVVENDVRAAAVGAAALLPATDSLAYLNLGTGVAAGIVRGGMPWRGARGAAGEIGHLSVDPAGPVCPCGQRGCIEAVAGGAGVAARWGKPSPLPVAEVFDCADAGDPLARILRADLVRGVAAAVQVLVLTADVELVVLGGGVSRLGERVFAPVRTALRAAASGSAFLASLDLAERLAPVPAGEPVGAVGAALLAGSPVGVAPGL